MEENEMAKRTPKPNDAEIAAMEARDASIREETLALFAAIKELSPPTGHEWRLDKSWDSWFSGSLIHSCRSGISIMLRSTTAESDDPDQLHGEIRLHRGVLRDFAYRPESAIVWFERGSRISGSPRIDHVLEGSRHVDCDGPIVYDLIKDESTGRMRSVATVQKVDSVPMTARHVHAGSWAAMTKHLLASIELMLEKDAAIVEGGRGASKNDDQQRLVA